LATRKKEEHMSENPNPSADPEQPEGGFAEGQADPAKYPEDEEVGRFSEGQEELGEEDPEKHHHGRFSEGQEELGEEDPEKHHHGRFSEGQEELGEDDPEKHARGRFSEGQDHE
jgi:hypothetical protein